MRHTAVSDTMGLLFVAFGTLLAMAGLSFFAMGLHVGIERPSLLSEWRLYPGFLILHVGSS